MARHPFRSAVLALVFSLCITASLAAEVTIGSVAPKPATTGTVLTITGTGFAAAKPSVSLTQAGVKKKYTLKVTAYSDGEIQAEIGQAIAGSFDVNVKVKKEVATFVNGVTIVGPSIASFDVAEGFAKDLVTITGTFLGTKKGKVKVGTKIAKVKSWANTAATFEIPKLAGGLYDVTLSNKISVDTAVGALNVKIPPPPLTGKDYISCKIDGKPFSLSGPTLVGSFSSLTDHVLVQATTLKLPVKLLGLNVDYDFVNGPVPATYTNSLGMLASYSESTTTDLKSWTNLLPGSQFTITIVNKDVATKTVALTFSGNLILSSGAGPESIQITEGVCKTTMIEF